VGWLLLVALLLTDVPGAGDVPSPPSSLRLRLRSPRRPPLGEAGASPRTRAVALVRHPLPVCNEWGSRIGFCRKT
ncbi:hypothetical protein, partial [Acetobacter senegalensis]|uniref:hypothetical protein n=1 Tax=Acetobacter senegalensis TaxID=446692 RepID=UPI0026572438